MLGVDEVACGNSQMKLIMPRLTYAQEAHVKADMYGLRQRAKHPAGVIELWQLLGQFQQALKTDDVPNLSELAESAAAPVESDSDNDTFNESMVRQILLILQA